MARRVFVHLGTAKSGTTVLQSVLWENRVALADAGLSFPGLRPDSHWLATLDLLGMAYAGYENPLAAGGWDRVTTAVAAAPGDAVVSHELLSRADDVQAERAVRSLEPAEVHLVVTVRHLARQAGSAWQENLRNGQVEDWPSFEAAITGAEGSDRALADVFWTYQDYPAVLARWAKHVKPENVHVVALVPGSVVWHDLAAVLGVDPDLATLPASVLPNRSLGMQQAELLRLVNVRLRDRIGFREYATAVKEALSMEVLSRQPHPSPIRLGPEQFAQISDKHEGFVTAVREAGYDVDPRIDDLDPGVAATPEDLQLSRASAPGLALGADVLADYVLQVTEDNYVVDPVAKLKRAALDLVEVRPSARRALRYYLRGKQVVARRRGPAA